MQKELISLFSRVRIGLPVVPASAAVETADAASIASFNAELAVFGYSFGPSVLEHLRTLPGDQFAAERGAMLELLAVMSGQDVSTDLTLFAQFPYVVPDQNSYLVRRIVGALSSRFGISKRDATVLSCGHVIHARLFRLSEFGACPICQHGVAELSGTDSTRHAFRSSTPLRLLSFADAAFITGQGNALLARNSSLSAAEKGFLREVMAEFVLDEPKRLFRETLPFFYAMNPDAAAHHVGSATDVLRIATYLSNPVSGDLSLTENVRFKVSTSHRRRLLGMLNACHSPAADMLRHRERWLRLGEVLHPGSSANRQRFPLAAEAFTMLRRVPDTIQTVNRTVERKLRAHLVDDLLVVLLSGRPGEFLRRLDVMLRNAADAEIVLGGLRIACNGATTKLLFEIAKYLRFRGEAPNESRVFIVKGVKTKVTILPDRRAPIAADVLSRAQAVVTTELTARFKGLEAMGQVFIDDRLAGLVLPFNRRGDSEASVSLCKGSRYPVAETPVLRLFVHWTGDQIDVDLSARFFDETFERSDHISYTNLSGFGAAHSGDIQSAPHGASEYIDVTVSTAREKGWRYLAMSVISFRGQPFDKFPCFAGFMQRDALRSGAKYEPASVALKFDVSGKSTSRVPVLFDLMTSEIIYVDLDSGSRAHASVAVQGEKFQALARMAVSLPARKPTVHDVLSQHVAARGERVMWPEQAERVFTFENTDVDKFAAEFVV